MKVVSQVNGFQKQHLSEALRHSRSLLTCSILKPEILFLFDLREIQMRLTCCSRCRRVCRKSSHHAQRRKQLPLRTIHGPEVQKREAFRSSPQALAPAWTLHCTSTVLPKPTHGEALFLQPGAQLRRAP